MDSNSQEIKQAFERYDREVAINNIKIGCILGMVLVPSFTIIDYSVYPKLAGVFLCCVWLAPRLLACFLRFC